MSLSNDTRFACSLAYAAFSMLLMKEAQNVEIEFGFFA